MRVKARRRGFSLVELLLVVAIILVVAAIAIPNYLQTRIRANEAAAVSNIRTLVGAQAMYVDMFPDVGFAPDVTSLGGVCGTPAPGAACLISNDLAGPRQGYLLTITPRKTGTVNTGFVINGTPLSAGITGKRGFCADESGVVKYSLDGSTVCTDPVPF